MSEAERTARSEREVRRRTAVHEAQVATARVLGGLASLEGGGLPGGGGSGVALDVMLGSHHTDTADPSSTPLMGCVGGREAGARVHSRVPLEGSGVSAALGKLPAASGTDLVPPKPPVRMPLAELQQRTVGVPLVEVRVPTAAPFRYCSAHGGTNGGDLAAAVSEALRSSEQHQRAIEALLAA